MSNLSATPQGLQTIRSLKEQLIKIAANTYGKRSMISVTHLVEWLEENEKVIEDAIARVRRERAEIMKMYEPTPPEPALSLHHHLSQAAERTRRSSPHHPSAERGRGMSVDGIAL